MHLQIFPDAFAFAFISICRWQKHLHLFAETAETDSKVRGQLLGNTGLTFAEPEAEVQKRGGALQG